MRVFTLFPAGPAAAASTAASPSRPAALSRVPSPSLPPFAPPRADSPPAPWQQETVKNLCTVQPEGGGAPARLTPLARRCPVGARLPQQPQPTFCGSFPSEAGRRHRAVWFFWLMTASTGCLGNDQGACSSAVGTASGTRVHRTWPGS